MGQAGAAYYKAKVESRFPLHRNAGFQLPELRCKTDRNTQRKRQRRMEKGIRM